MEKFLPVLFIFYLFSVCYSARVISSNKVIFESYQQEVFEYDTSSRVQITENKVRNNITNKLTCYWVLPDKILPNQSIPDDVNSTLCTHGIFIPTFIKNNQISTSQENLAHFRRAIPALKKQNPILKILLCNGGDFSSVLASPENRSSFASNTAQFLRQYGFDGIDLDWEFPSTQQRQNYSLFLQVMRAVYEDEAKRTGNTRLILSAAVASSIIGAYNCTAMSQTLDLVNLMEYDFHGYSDSYPLTDYNAPLFPHILDPNCVSKSANEWAKCIPKEKLMVGVPTYGRIWTLWYTWWHGHRAPAKGPGHPPECDYTWACELLKNKTGTRVWDDTAKVPYIYYGDQWVSYDDADSLTFKTKWAIDNGFGGIMLFDTRSDDYAGKCGSKFNLTATVHNTLFQKKN